MANEHLPPLGLLSIGGPLIDAGHEVQLLDADYYNYKIQKVVALILEQTPDAILLGHSGSTSAQPILLRLPKGSESKINRSKSSSEAFFQLIIGKRSWKTIHRSITLCAEKEKRSS